MKKLKQIVTQIKSHAADPSDDLNNLLWQYICYSPKMPVRLHQEELLNKAEKSSLKVNDVFFTHIKKCISILLNGEKERIK